DIAGDPVLYGNLPPREISMKDVFRSGDSSKKFKIAEGQWYRYAPSYVSPAYHLLEGFPFIQEPPSGDLQARVLMMLPLLVWLTPDLRIKKSLLKCNWTIRKRLPRCKMRLKKRLLAFSRRLHARIRKTRYMHKMRCLLINRRSLLLALRLLW